MACRLLFGILILFQFSNLGLAWSFTKDQSAEKTENSKPVFYDQNSVGNYANETVSKLYFLKFWSIFKQLKLPEIEKYYEENVIQLRSSILRHPKIGIDTDMSGITTFSKKEVLTSIYRLNRFAPIQCWIQFFNHEYKVNIDNIELSTVKNSEPNIRTFFQSNLNVFQLLLKPQFFIEGVKHRLKIDSEDLVFIIREKPKRVFGSLIFVFDKNTHKIKAQTLLIGVPPQSNCP